MHRGSPMASDFCETGGFHHIDWTNTMRRVSPWTIIHLGSQSSLPWHGKCRVFDETLYCCCRLFDVEQRTDKSGLVADPVGCVSNRSINPRLHNDRNLTDLGWLPRWISFRMVDLFEMLLYTER